MKRILALLLVLCMAVSLIACKKPADSSDGTKPGGDLVIPEVTTPIREDVNNIEVEVMKPAGNVADSNDEFINPEKFGGKTLQIYGCSSVVYDDIENLEGQGTFVWMMRAAIDDWAALNNVTISYEGDYNANAILGAINSGSKPDLLLMNQQIPGAANLGIADKFSEEEYKAISDIIGEPLLKACDYKGESYGLILPWSGATWFRFNESLFESYGVKSPLDYYKEGNWTWETMEDCFESVTKDFDGNGKIDNADTFGCATLIAMMEPYQYEEKEDGTLVSLIETSEYFRSYAEMLYRGTKETLSLAGPSNLRCTIVTTPRPATHVGDAEWYNYVAMNRLNDNGEKIKTVPLPIYSQEDPQRFTILTQQSLSIMSSCDEREATMALICYMMKVGMRYMSDFSCGLYKCDYEAMRGASEYSKAYLVRLNEIIEERRAEFAEIEDWDQETYEKMVSEMLTSDTIVRRRYTGKKNLDKALAEMPPASSLPLAAATQKAWITKYNSLYAAAGTGN